MRIENSSHGAAVSGYENAEAKAEPNYAKQTDHRGLLDRAAQWLPVNDESAASAIERMKSDEWDEGWKSEYQPWEPDIYGGPPPTFPQFVQVPTGDRLTGQELTGYVLEGVMDKGNELNELQQFQAARNSLFIDPNPSAQRVFDVVDRWVGILQANGQTEMTPEQKAQFAAELSEAAKPDRLGPARRRRRRRHRSAAR